MAFYTAYCDESGHEKNQRLLVCAGLVLCADNPYEFEAAWKAAIQPRTEFHAVQHLQARTHPERGLKLSSKISETIGRYALRTFATVLDMSAYSAIDERYAASEWIGHPLTVCARICRAQVNDWQRNNSITAQTVMVFEEREFSQTDIAAVFVRDGQPAPMFMPKHSVAALDAADYLAWMTYQKEINSDKYKMYKDTFGGLWASLHERELVTISAAERICKLSKAIERERTGKGEVIAFHTTPDQIRKRFK